MLNATAGGLRGPHSRHWFQSRQAVLAHHTNAHLPPCNARHKQLTNYTCCGPTTALLTTHNTTRSQTISSTATPAVAPRQSQATGYSQRRVAAAAPSPEASAAAPSSSLSAAELKQQLRQSIEGLNRGIFGVQVGLCVHVL